jgi:hypothetical protein
MNMLPLSAKRRIAFTPEWREQEEPKPIYFLRVPTIEDRTEFGCQLLEKRARLVLRAEFVAEARRAIAAIEPDNAGDISALLDRVKAVVEPDPLPDEDAVQLAALESVLVEQWPPYARLVAANTRWSEYMPTLACRMFLTGWQNGPDGQDRASGGLDDAARMLIPRLDMVAIGLKAFQLMTLSEAQTKNSPSPSPSRSSQTSSPAASAASTAAPGASSDSDTSAIPGSC